MIELKTIKEIRAESVESAKAIIEEIRVTEEGKGNSLGSCSYTHKEKKSKGEIIDECWVVKITINQSTVWGE